MALKDQITLLRKTLKLSQTEFGRRISISGGAVSLIESGHREPSERTIADICKVYSARRDWLEHGEEPMFFPAAEDDQIIEEALAESPEIVRALLKGIARTPGGWETLRQALVNIAEELDKMEKPGE